MGNLQSFLHWQFLGIWQSLWRSFLESLHVYTTQIRNKWDCWKSSAQSKRWHLCRIVAIRSGWKLVGRFHGMQNQSAKRSRSLIWWEDPYERRFGKPFKGPIIPFGSLVEVVAVWIWKGDILIADLEDWKIGRERNIDQTKRWWIHISFCRWYSKIVRKRPRIPRTQTCKEWRSQWRTLRRTGRVSNDRNKRWRWCPERLLVDPRWLHLSSSHWTSSSTPCIERRNIPYSTEIHRRDQSFS